MSEYQGKHEAPRTPLQVFNDACDAAREVYRREVADSYDDYADTLRVAAHNRGERTRTASLACERAIVEARAEFDRAKIEAAAAGHAGA